MLSIAKINTITISSLKRTVFISSYNLQSVIQRVRVGTEAGTWRQRLKQNQEQTQLPTDCLALLGFLSLPSYVKQDQQPRRGTARSGLDPPTPIVFSKVSRRFSPQVNLMEEIPRLRFYLPKSLLCVSNGRNLTSTNSIGSFISLAHFV